MIKHRMVDSKLISINEVNIWVSRSFSGNKVKDNSISILSISGGPGFEDYLEPVSNMIDDLYPVIRFEPRGCGRSDRIGPYDFQTVISDIEGIREHFKISEWILLGHSWGATVALVYGLQYPNRIKSIIYMNGIGIQHNIDWHAEFHRNKMEMADPLPEMKYEYLSEVNNVGNKSWWEYIQTPYIWREISEMNIPVLILQAEKDVRPNWPAKQLSEALPNAIYREVKDAVHCIWLSHPDILKEELRSYIENK